MEAMFITNLRLPKEIIEEIDKIVEESGGRYITRTQFIREAVVEKLKK